MKRITECQICGVETAEPCPSDDIAQWCGKRRAPGANDQEIVDFVLGVHDRLDGVRRERGMTLADVARRAGLSKQALTKLRFYSARGPGVGTIMRLALAVDVDPAWLAFGEGKEK